MNCPTGIVEFTTMRCYKCFEELRPNVLHTCPLGGCPVMWNVACEIEEGGEICGAPAEWQSLFAWNLQKSRFLWVCQKHNKQLSDFVAELPES